MKILAVDDQPANLLAIEAMLADLDVEVVTASSGREALRRLLIEDFAVVLLDVHMPELDGFETAKLIRERERTRYTPIIFLTASHEKHLGEMHGYETGAVDYLIKPVDPIILKSKLRVFVELAAARAKLQDYAQQLEGRARLFEEKYGEIMEHAQDAIFIVDPSGTILEANKHAEVIWGRPRADLSQMNFHELVAAAPGGGVPSGVSGLLTCESPQRAELQIQCSDGKKKWIELSASRVPLPDQSVVLVIVRDVTERKETEAKFLRAQRLESLGTLASGIAHDLNNMLAPILMSIEILRLQIADEAGLRVLDNIESAAQRGAAMVKQILAFARGREGEFTELQIRHLIGEVAKIVKSTFPPNIQTRREASKDLWTIRGDATQLHQVLMNLCVNARDAMSSGGQLTIQGQNFIADESYARQQPGAKAGPYVVVSVADTGTGIAPETLERIFDPFFTTKEVGKGTGLGLATALGIAQSHGGFVTVNSEVGQGTEFRVYLPALPAAEAAETNQKKTELPKGRGEWILVADDEATIRDITKSALESHSYQVLTAGDGAEAIAVYAQRRHDVRLVITDMAMPFMDGPALIRALHRLNPEVKLLAVSGHMENARLTEVAGHVSVKLLLKPFTTGKLLVIVREILDGKTTGM